jgi:methylenetetrahydrofolate dehydrogenase (NADP+)/methenyltetrahydrofolate cyclohydrolase
LECFKDDPVVVDPREGSFDVDNISPYCEDYLSCTAEACVAILLQFVELSGKHICIIGRGHAVQMLRDALLHGYDATVTVCHSKTKNLREIAATADIVINSAPRLNPYRDVGFKVDRILLDISGALCDWEDSNLLTYIGPREIGRVNTAIVLNRFADVM